MSEPAPNSIKRSPAYRMAMGLGTIALSLFLFGLVGWMILTQPGFPLSASVYPDQREVEAFFTRYDSIATESAREEVVRDLLRALNFPAGAEQERVCDLAFEGLKRRYQATHDAAVPGALDKAKVGARFGPRVCGLYRSLAVEPQFIARLRADPAAAFGLARCDGLGWTSAEIAALSAASN